MSITLEEANLLVRSHGLLADDVETFTNLLRTYGVRRENARKNIGKVRLRLDEGLTGWVARERRLLAISR